ncbi:small, acid-soluble spore protein L [Terrilactibacillus sp. S3-3]|nr:small, acid-soluble spore protein L [Terrilactibacillus sp. S3-3]
MSKARRKDYRSNTGKTASSVNPAGYSKDAASQEPVSELEKRAKKNI